MVDQVPGRDTAAGLHGPALSVVVPCYNEAEGLQELHRRLVAAIEPIFADDFEIVLVNDGRAWSHCPMLIRACFASTLRAITVTSSR